MVGEHQVLVAESDGGSGHRLHRGTAVAPPAVEVEVTEQGFAVNGAGGGERNPGPRLELDDVGDVSPCQSLFDDLRR